MICQPLVAECFALAAVWMSTEAVTQTQAAGLVRALLGDTPFCVQSTDGGMLWLFRWGSKPAENQVWSLKAGGQVTIAWGGRPIPLWPNAEYGQWLRHPAAFGPDDLPFIDEDKIVGLVDAIHALAPVVTMGSESAAKASACADIPIQASYGPLSPVGRLAVPWRVDREGLVVAGIRHWIKAVARHHVAFGGNVDRPAVEDAVQRNVMEGTSPKALGAHAEHILSWVTDAVGVAIAMNSRTAGNRAGRMRVYPRRTALEISPYEPEWLADLAPADVRGDISSTLGVEPGLQPGFDEVGLDRNEVREALGNIVTDAIEGFIHDVSGKVPRVRLLTVPPGVGKTTRTLARLLFGRGDRMDRPPGPIGFLMPNYGNIEELRDRIRSAGVDVCWLPARSDEDIQKARNPNAIKVLTFAGRIQAGCAIPEKMKLAMEIGQGSALCRATTPDGDDVFCPHFSTCPAILQRKQVNLADIVLMPHQFLVSTMPAELAGLKGIVIDERTDNLFMGSCTVPLDEITAPRRRIKTTKAMRREGMNAETIMAARQSAWEHMAKAMERGVDPVFLAATTPEIAGLFRQAEAYCNALSNRDIHVSPLTTVEALRDAAGRPVGRFLEEEQRLWRALIEDIDEMRLGSARIKWVLLSDGRRGIRISWREVPNWTNVPKLLLDGSASVDIISRLWPAPQHQPVDGEAMLVEHRSPTHEISVNALLPTLLIQSDDTAKGAILPRGDLTASTALRAAHTVARVRRMLSILAGRNAEGRVLVGGMKAVIATIQDGWTPPANMDFCHYGALRGLNIYEHHKLAISIGRLEIPPDIIEGLAASLGYDDPEWPGPDPEQSGVAAIPVIMRDGRKLSIPSPVAADKWSRAVQTVSREEELRQFAGRLRAVQRVDGSYPDIAWVLIGNVVPENTVLDAVLGAEDILADRFVPLFEVARRTGGVIPKRSAGEWIDDMPVSASELADLFNEFGSNRTIRRSWRLMERKICGIVQPIFVARHLKRSVVDELLTSLQTMEAFSTRVSGFDDLGDDPLAEEVSMFRDVLHAAGFNPDAEASTEMPLSPGGLPLAISWTEGDLGHTPLWVACAGGAIARNLVAQRR